MRLKQTLYAASIAAAVWVGSVTPANAAPAPAQAQAQAAPGATMSRTTASRTTASRTTAPRTTAIGANGLLNQCWPFSSGPATPDSGRTVAFSVTIYCDTIIDYLAIQLRMFRLVGGVEQLAPGSITSCMNASISALDCTSSVLCPGSGYYSGFATMQATNATGVFAEESQYQPLRWITC